MFQISEVAKRKEIGFGFGLRTPCEYYPTESPHNFLNLRFWKTSVWWEVPAFIKPVEKWVDLSDREFATPNPQTGKKGYTQYIQRVYGFSVDATALHVYYGTQPGCWSRNDPKNSDHSKCYFIPWNEWIRTKVEFVNWRNLDVAYVAEEGNDRINFEALEKGRDTVEKIQIKFNDYDGEETIATCHIEEFFYNRGTGWFKWLGIFMKKSYRRLEIQFDKEVGGDKGSWKGGTIGTSANIDHGWNWRYAFRKYAENHGFTNIQFLE